MSISIRFPQSRLASMRPIASFVFLVTCLILFVVPAKSEGQSQLPARDVTFQTPSGLEGRVDFWRKIFTKYGKNHRVFHDREYPEVIYSVLDFTEFEEQLTGRKLVRAKRKAAKEELARIRQSLRHLGAGKKPRDDFEKRIQRIFQAVHGSGSRRYRQAASKKRIRYQSGIKEKFYDGLVRSGRYLSAIEEIFRANGLPVELGRLPLVESSFNYKAYSSKGAAGIWQFMRSTGKLYMRVNASIDERRDPIIATRAAARYLKNSFKSLRSWPLAVTSYNHGLAGVRRAVKKTGSRKLAVIIRKYQGKRFGFASSNFYAEFLAAVEVERNAEIFFPGIKREKPMRFDEVRLGKSLRFRDLLRLSGSSKEVVEGLNLQLKSPVLRNRVSIPRGSYVKVPPGHGAKLAANIKHSSLIALNDVATTAGQKSARSSSGGETQTYKVRRGDTLGQIARKYSVSISRLMRANNIKNAKRIRVGQRLSIPGTTRAVAVTSPKRKSDRSKAAVKPIKQATRTTASQHKVRRGESLFEISLKYKVSMKKLISYNNLKNPKVLSVGQIIKIPGKSGGVAASSTKLVERKSRYVVVRGDTLSRIAKKHGTSVKKLRALNAGLKSRIYPGQKLLVP